MAEYPEDDRELAMPIALQQKLGEIVSGKLVDPADAREVLEDGWRWVVGLKGVAEHATNLVQAAASAFVGVPGMEVMVIDACNSDSFEVRLTPVLSGESLSVPAGLSRSAIEGVE